MKQIKNARHGFQPTEMLCFLQKLASVPHGSLERSIHLIKKEAFVPLIEKRCLSRLIRHVLRPMDRSKHMGGIQLGF